MFAFWPQHGCHAPAAAAPTRLLALPLPAPPPLTARPGCLTPTLAGPPPCPPQDLAAAAAAEEGKDPDIAMQAGHTSQADLAELGLHARDEDEEEEEDLPMDEDI